MSGFVLFAQPWWVNALFLVPAVPYLFSRRVKLRVGKRRLLLVALFGIAFGFVEAAVVAYLRAATNLWPVPQLSTFVTLSQTLLRIECFREAATIVMLVVIAWISSQDLRQKAAVFLWTFAFWDLFYYIWLRLTIAWPARLTDPDILFLLPVPWLAQVWFPILISLLTAIVIWFRD